jgi:type VI secretion system secreted protein VgrG
MLSRSSKGGGGADGNEIRLEDSKGKEELYIHGQKDLVIEAENLVSSAVGYPDPYPFPKPGAGCRKVTVKQDEILIVKVGNRETTIETGNETKTISSGKQTNTIATDQTTKVGANQSLSVSGNQSVTVGGNQTVSAGGSRKLTISGSDTVEVSGSRTITAGSSISISAGSEIKLSVGGSTITIGPSGISISAATVDVTGSGPVTIKGAVVKVNS